MTAPAADAAPAIVIGLGELLWDVFPDERRPGGAPANVAFHANQLGLRGVVCSRVGRDALGDELCEYLAQRGLDPGVIQRDDDRPTGTVTVHTDGDGPAYTIHERVAWDFLELSDGWRDALGRAAAVCFGSLAQRSPTSRATIADALQAAPQAWRIFDINLRPPFYDAEILDASLRSANVVKCNDQEVPELARLLQIPSDDAATVARHLLAEYSIEIAVITRGGAGAWLLQEGETVDADPESVDVVDTVGAGDAFTAGLAYGLIRGWSLEATGRLANRVAGLVASRAGAMPALADEFKSLVGA